MDSHTITVVRIDAWDVANILDRLAPLVSDSRANGFNMLRRLADGLETGENRFREPSEALFGVLGSDGVLVAVGGLNRNAFPEDPQAGRLRRVYVHSECRRIGLGRAIVSEIIVRAREVAYLSIVLRAPDSAFAFYASMGFERVVDSQSATHRLNL
ncbi:MAG: GNAT family N-acetyltransferase [Fimbriimonas sp.]|nr:GNAT family N-acetyltransferase [Fimbriimonas sp.]